MKVGWAILGIVLAGGRIQAADKLHVLSILDLSGTQKVAGASGNSEFVQNVAAITTILTSLPAASRFTVVGIVERSYTDPRLLLDVRIGADAGPLGSRLAAARREVVSEWRKRTKDLLPNAPHSDVLGACIYGGQIFSSSVADRKVLVALTDLRQDVELNLETVVKVDIKSSLKYVEQHNLIASLAGVEVWVFGAGARGTGRNSQYFEGLRAFWLEWFRRTGASVRWFSPGRENHMLLEVTADNVKR